jgi:Spy/CpxP family protein refolding chaperone
MRGIWIKNSVLLLGMTLTGAALLAQQPTTPAPEAATQKTAPAERSPLTVEQKKQLSDLHMAARDQEAIVRNDQALTAEQKQAKLKELRASTHEQMKAVLTPEQQKAFADRHAAAKARFAAKLALTPEQQGKMKDLFGSTHQQRDAVLKDASLTNEQKQVQLTKIRETSQATLATILTPEQLAKFHQMRKSHRHAKQG